MNRISILAPINYRSQDGDAIKNYAISVCASVCTNTDGIVFIYLDCVYVLYSVSACIYSKYLFSGTYERISLYFQIQYGG